MMRDPGERCQAIRRTLSLDPGRTASFRPSSRSLRAAALIAGERSVPARQLQRYPLRMTGMPGFRSTDRVKRRAEFRRAALFGEVALRDDRKAGGANGFGCHAVDRERRQVRIGFDRRRDLLSYSLFAKTKKHMRAVDARTVRRRQEILKNIIRRLSPDGIGGDYYHHAPDP